MRIDNQQQQNKGVMDLMPQTGAVEEKNGIQMFADAVKTESSKNLQELRLSGKRDYLSESGKRREKDGHR